MEQSNTNYSAYTNTTIPMDANSADMVDETTNMANQIPLPNGMNYDSNQTTVRTVESGDQNAGTNEGRLYGSYRSNVDAITSRPFPRSNQSTQTTRVRMPDFTNTTQQQMEFENPNFFTPLGTSNGLSNGGMDYTVYPMINPSQTSPNYLNYNRNSAQGMYLPYGNTYMPTTFPLYPTNNYNEERDAERDVEYLKQLYPQTCKRLLDEIEEECDKLEYDGSCMFDEYPDRVCLDRIIDRIYNRVKDREEFQEGLESTSPTNSEVEANQVNYSPTRRRNWLRDIIELMFLQEISHRRRRHRSRRRWF